MVIPPLFLSHPIHDRRPVVHFTDLVGSTRTEQNTLCRGRLTRIDVRHDADVSDHGYGRDCFAMFRQTSCATRVAFYQR